MKTNLTILIDFSFSWQITAIPNGLPDNPSWNVVFPNTATFISGALPTQSWVGSTGPNNLILANPPTIPISGVISVAPGGTTVGVSVELSAAPAVPFTVFTAMQVMYTTAS